MKVLSVSAFIMMNSMLLLLWPAMNCSASETEQHNMSIVRWITDNGVNKQNPAAWDSVLTENYVRHCEAMPPGLERIEGLTAMKSFLADHFKAFPDWNEEIIQLLADSNMVAYITRGTGTHTGPMGDVSPTGKKLDALTFIFHRFENGKIAESWVNWDNLVMLRQLGLTPGGEAGESKAETPHDE